MEKENVNKIFQSIAGKYDLMNDLMSFGLHRKWKEKFVDLIDLNLKKKNIILDLGCGTGDIIFQINNKSKLNSNYLACLVDPNTEMMKHGIKKFKKKNISWLASYGEKLPFKNNEFDYYTISFGIRNVNKINLVLDEAVRVLKPGGKFMCLEFSKVKSEILDRLYQIYSQSIPKIGKLVVGKSEPYEYLIKSIKEFYSQEELLKLMEKSNFTNCSYKNLNGGIVAIHSGWKI